MEPNKRNDSNHSLPWNLATLYQSPRVFPVPDMDEGDIKGIFYEGLSYQGRATRIFAYYAIPESTLDAKVPGIVLVHGGGGTAFKEWVRMWVDRGYAAIAMDLEGHVATLKNSDGVWSGHDWSGPSRHGEFADFALPMEDQWMYHAVADVILAHSFLRSFDILDKDKIGVNGISWGGIVASLVAGVDNRLSFAIPVYGCGYLFEANNQYGESFAKMPPEYARKTKQLWDPSAYFDRISIPMLWVNWSHDPHFPLHLFSRSYQAAQRCVNQSSLSIHFGLRHSHKAGWKPQEIYVFADQITREGQALPQVLRQEVNETHVKVEFTSELPVMKAELCYSFDTSNWFEVEWFNKPAYIDSDFNHIHAILEDGTCAYFIQITDERGCLVSSPIQCVSF
ncbi:S9 family peptidase [Paenibacillus sp. N3.4]|uniref:alpha/beta hydrolase family protein n=1 Tax=Paenibacillus sp. N3.4 TaxID=2603222 RepID=UPI0011CAB1F2|nr:alpha/beta fold hydrolase [Paenibacillus sp. N3.4]TXK83804.1 prolyl oligopeptidase family serine peptidase [Paenibacillus sp. N3.4]